MIEFSLEGEVRRDGNRWVVGGRCYRGPIRIGDCFNLAYHNEPVIVDGEYVSSIRSTPRPVHLRVERIFTYGHFVDELWNGVTAELTMSLFGETTLSQGEVIADEMA